eukprot:scaffold2501_cov423-Prasinococcus_capsulatus_cf.AAC.2
MKCLILTKLILLGSSGQFGNLKCCPDSCCPTEDDEILACCNIPSPPPIAPPDVGVEYYYYYQPYHFYDGALSRAHFPYKVARHR